MPVGNGGKFTPEAKAIYELVLEMQKVWIMILATRKKLACSSHCERLGLL